MTKQYDPKERLINRFGNNNIIYSNDYHSGELDTEDFMIRAQYFVDNGYPVKTKNIQELAHILQEKHKKTG